MIHATPEELAAAKKAIFRTGITAREYLDRQDDIDRIATEAIKGYVLSMRSTPAVALLRIAADMSDGAERDMIEAIREILNLSDPEDAPNAVDCAHDAIDAVGRTHWNL